MPHALRFGVVLAAALAVAAPTAHAGHPEPAATTALAGSADSAAMADLEAKITDALQVGHVVPVDFDSPAQLPGHVIRAPYWGDTQLWSGVYVGGESMRYAVAKAHLGELAGQHDNSRATRDAIAGWTAQRDEALQRVRTILDAQHRDVSIAEDWVGTPNLPPRVNTSDPRGPHTLDYGGGVVHGERGLVTRGCTPKGLGPMGISPPNHDPNNPVNDSSNHVYEITWTHGDGVTYYCETSPSRDTYAGLTFGMLTAFDLVTGDEPRLRAQVRDDLLAMAHYLVAHGWNHVRPNGAVGTNNDEDGFVSPLMEHVPLARLNIVNAARHVADTAGTAADKQTWDAIWAEELASQGPLVAANMQVDAAQPSSSYFKFNLNHLLGFNLLRTTVGSERDLFARGFAVMDKTTRDDVNAHFEALTFGLTGEPSRRDAAVTHLEQWLDYRAAVTGGGPVHNSARCGADLECVPVDRSELLIDQAPSGSVAWYPETAPFSDPSHLRAAAPLPVVQRPPADFLWQAPPTALDGQQDASHREPGIDFLTPYWTVRYFTEVAAPALSPFPDWAGPASR
ncbi:MAG: hypothetical protein QOJ92_688 [Frankiales bacterium]|jgi:hypothetical protein|nr:hypothetical protein [Frankiales bacterium]MDX6273478.1 hypothetical protein [Frankiales bacterium]